jgi:hypothetical protein
MPIPSKEQLTARLHNGCTLSFRTSEKVVKLAMHKNSLRRMAHGNIAPPFEDVKVRSGFLRATNAGN